MNGNVITGRWGDAPEADAGRYEYERDPSDDYEDGYSNYAAHDLGCMTRITLIKDHVVDVERVPISGSGFEFEAQRLGAGRPAPPPPPPEPPAFSKQLAWLERIAGGAAHLATLDDAPLTNEAVEFLPTLAGDFEARLRRAVERIEEYAPVLIGAEGAIAASRLLLRAVAKAPRLINATSRDDVLVGGAILAVGKGNLLVGANRLCTNQDVAAVCRLSSSPASKANSLADLVSGDLDWPWGWRYSYDTPKVLRLGSPDLLVSSFRRSLIKERDIAIRLRDATVTAATLPSRGAAE